MWCNGNTTDFGSVIMGSTPVTSTIIDNHGRDINAPNGLVGDAVSLGLTVFWAGVSPAGYL